MHEGKHKLERCEDEPEAKYNKQSRDHWLNAQWQELKDEKFVDKIDKEDLDGFDYACQHRRGVREQYAGETTRIFEETYRPHDSEAEFVHHEPCLP